MDSPLATCYFDLMWRRTELAWLDLGLFTPAYGSPPAFPEFSIASSTSPRQFILYDFEGRDPGGGAARGVLSVLGESVRGLFVVTVRGRHRCFFGLRLRVWFSSLLGPNNPEWL